LRVPFAVAVDGREYELDIPHLVQCKTCEGSGAKAGSKPTTCTKCGGQGQVRMAQRTVFGTFEQVATCPTCKGEGKVISNPCSDCHGSGQQRKFTKVKVRVPAGVETGTRLRVTGAGNAGLRGGPPGDLYIFIEVEESRLFERDGADLHSEISIPFTQAALGEEVTIDSANGKIKVEVPAGIQPGTTLRLKGKGLTNLSSTTKGDHFVKVNVSVPKTLNDKQKHALQEFAKLLNSEGVVNETEKRGPQKKKQFFWDE